MLRGVVVLVAIAGCYRPTLERSCEVGCTVDLTTNEHGPCPNGLICFDDGVCRQSDGNCPAETDGSVPDSDGGAMSCFGTTSLLSDMCIPTPTSSLELGTTLAMIDTDEASMCDVVFDQNSDPADALCVVAGTMVTVSNGFRAVGARPLVIASLSDIIVGGVVDVSSRRTDPRAGAGAGFHGCIPGLDPIAGSMNGPGGGGGSFKSAGGNGGNGNAMLGGTPGQTDDPSIVHGGCAGVTGADAAGQSKGNGGRGGGAVFLIAKQTISVDAQIMAVGEGAQGGAPSSGGGGGGSGGLIGLDATIITINLAGSINANGGGGGAAGGNGSAGGDGSESVAFDQAGQAGVTGGNGSLAGSTGAVGSMGNSPNGGGGGGGGSGWLIVNRTPAGAGAGRVSPSATTK